MGIPDVPADVALQERGPVGIARGVKVVSCTRTKARADGDGAIAMVVVRESVDMGEIDISTSLWFGVLRTGVGIVQVDSAAVEVIAVGVRGTVDFGVHSIEISL